ncbi:MAG: membrane protein insertion efficiency factor YidD [Deltaproteobacteria bacterium]|nr:membrane protein insertion efficiency factor YidD [Deltaproteobacteria bacterium]
MVLVFIIDIYQFFLSPFIGRQCRFYPTCSNYAREAILIHGAIRGAVLAIWRVLRCNPLGAGGYDPVPFKRGKNVIQKGL